MSFNHVIKLLVNLLVFFFGARREDESRLELRALAAFVLLLAQCLVGPVIRKGRTDGRRDSQMKGEKSGRKRMMGGGQKAEGGRTEEGREVRGRFGVHWEVLTHSLCLLIIRSMSSFIFLYLSSDSGLWPTESSASGSGLSQPFRPFFLNVCKQSSRTAQLRGRWGQGAETPANR